MDSMKRLVWLLFLVFIGSANGKEKYLVGVENLNYLPYYGNNDGIYQGYGRELLDLFAEYKGCDFDYKVLPVKRLFSEFLDGKLDFKFPDHPYWSFEDKEGKNVIYSNDVVEYIDGVMVKPENVGKGIEHLKNMGVVLGFTAWDYVKYIDNGSIKRQENSNFEGMIRQALISRNDGAYCNVGVGRHLLKNVIKEPDGLIFDEGLPFSKSHYKFSSIKYPTIIEEFNKFLIEKKSEIDKLKEKYSLK
ncbi:MAG: transporter substrate-binding domain-containing protein [Candidatus Delongbacteria bacterium]|nr:transporter substrate-binding domain-containing protein [Candidatus Delongbacteria bacterium]MBN2835581.1 transporter substrate-binding domain-containing protein [Candidatus Delongbacteria bacterium]